MKPTTPRHTGTLKFGKPKLDRLIALGLLSLGALCAQAAEDPARERRGGCAGIACSGIRVALRRE